MNKTFVNLSKEGKWDRSIFRSPLPADSKVNDNWRAFLSGREDDFDMVRQKTRTGRPCGDSSFLTKAENITKKASASQKSRPPKKRE